jgi:hypothetical protein
VLSLTNVLLGSISGLLVFLAARLWILNNDMQVVRTALSGFNGANGLLEMVQELELARGRHHVAIAILSGRLSDIDGKPDVEL